MRNVPDDCPQVSYPTGIDQTQSIGEATWKALCKDSVAPTPRNFELLFRHFSGHDRALSERLRPILDQTESLTGNCIATLYEEFVATDMAGDQVDASAESIADAAQDLVERVTCNQEALSGYSDVLAHWAGRMHAGGSIQDVMKAMAVLSSETSQAAERNRALEQQLSASTARIAKLRQELVDVRQASTTDALTGISNRKAFDGKLRRALVQSRKEISTPFCLLMLDVDHFKRFNDTHGHRTGDQVLRLVGRMLADNVKGRDTAARYGGEEFVVLLADANLAAGLTIAEQIRQRLSSQRLVKRGTGATIGQITISIGVAQHYSGESGSHFIERADAALYEAKRTGRNKVCAASRPGIDAVA